MTFITQNDRKKCLECALAIDVYILQHREVLAAHAAQTSTLQAQSSNVRLHTCFKLLSLNKSTSCEPTLALNPHCWMVACSCTLLGPYINVSYMTQHPESEYFCTFSHATLALVIAARSTKTIAFARYFALLCFRLYCAADDASFLRLKRSRR